MLANHPDGNSEQWGIQSLSQSSSQLARESTPIAGSLSMPQCNHTTEISKLLELTWQELDPYDYLEEPLAKLLTDTAQAMPTAVEFLFTTLLPVAASRIGTGARVVIKRSANYVQPCIVQTAIVAQSGTKKTPTQKAIIAPLETLESESANTARQAQEEKSEPPLKPLLRRRYLTKDCTPEALARILDESKPRGLLVYRDELAGNFKAQNKYRNGLGDDEEFELSLWNGDSTTKDRVSSSIHIEKTAISRTGSIQWESLQALMGSHEDFNGKWARWLFCTAKCPPSYLDLSDDSDPDLRLHDTLKNLYQQLGELPEKDYSLSSEAKQLFQKWQHHLIECQREESNLALQAAYVKMEAYTARFSLLLYIVNSVLRGESVPQPNIPAQEMQRAIALADYFIGQAKLIHARNSPESGLTGILLKIQEFAERKGRPIKAREVKAGVSQLRKANMKDIRQHFQTLADTKYGKVEGSGSHLTYKNNKKVEDINRNVETTSTARSPIEQHFQENVENVEGVDKVVSNPHVLRGELNSSNGNINNLNKTPQSITSTSTEGVEETSTTIDTYQQFQQLFSKNTNEPPPPASSEMASPLLGLSTASTTSGTIFQPGDKVAHIELGAGIVTEHGQIGQMVFCKFPCGARSPWAKDLTLID